METGHKKAFIEGNKGGDYVQITETDREGVVHLEVGQCCVVTIDEEVSVMTLASILTIAKDKGFEAVLREAGYQESYLRACSLPDNP